MQNITHETLRQALRASVKPCGGPSNGGLDNHMWAAVVDRTGVVRAVCFSGNALGDQWPGSRSIAIAKANTANGFSLPHFAFSTANLYFGAQPGADGHMDPRTLIVTDALLAFAIGLIAVTRLELALRTRNLRTAE